MAGEVNYKQKYQDLKAKYMSAVDMAFRLGFEEGQKQSQLDQANQQLQQAAQMQQAAMAGGQPGQPGAEGGAPGEGPDTNNNGAPGAGDAGGPDMSGAPSVQPPPQADPNAGAAGDGSELDQHIQKLESMVSMIAKSEADVTDLNKTINDLKSLQKSLKEQSDLRKSAAAIPEIVKALHKPAFKFGVQAQHNLNSTAKAAVTMHHKIVNDVMEKWEQEEQKAGKDILSQLSIEGLTKKE